MPSLPAGISLRTATPVDLPAIAGLRSSVGWTAHTWALRDAMRPPHARCFLAIDEAGEAVAVGSGISYGRLGVVGNMVVVAEHRRRGLGRAILEQIIEFLEGERRCTQLELTATDAGTPLYARHGFAPAGATADARLPVDGASAPATDEVRRATSDDLAEIVAYDTERFGGDRSPILAAAIDDKARPMLLNRREGSLVGYAVQRLGQDRLGPWLADDESAAAALLAAARAQAPSASHLVTVVPMANAPGVAWMQSIGGSVEPHGGRMRRGGGVVRREETIYGNAVGALG
jgi:GNAT superfamily N-acetyltransferase